MNTVYRIFRWYRVNRSGKAWRLLFIHYFHRMTGAVRPSFLILAPTYRCQCRCEHCAADPLGSDDGKELSTAQFLDIISQARKLGVIQVTFTGGEPLLRDDLEELIACAHNLGMITRIVTNGILLDSRRIAALKKAGLTQCSVSIDDADPVVHDRLRGRPGAYEAALEGIQNLIRQDILCQIHTVASKRNIGGGLERIIRLAKNLDVFAVCIGLPIAMGQWDGHFDQVITPEEQAEVRRLQDLKLVHLELPTSQTLCRFAQKGFLFVSPKGEITPCPFVPYAFGNIRDFPLKQLWRLHASHIRLDYRGECPMNDLQKREDIQKHVRSISQMLTRLKGK